MKNRFIHLLSILLALASLTVIPAHAGGSPTTAVAVSGTTIASIGADGKLYVYDQGDSLSMKALLVPAEDTFKGFRRAPGGVAIRDNLIAAGAPNSDAGGVVYLYERSAAGWKQSAILKGDPDDVNFGVSVSIGKDAVAVGASDKSLRGAVYLFKKKDAAWEQSSRLTPKTSEDMDQFGVAVSLDGDYLAIGTFHGDPQKQGMVYVFLQGPGTWDQQATLIPEKPEAEDYFGSTLALSGRTLLIGAPGANAAYVFTRGDNAWAQRQRIPGENGIRRSGSAVAISDTDLLIAGLDGAQLYTRNNSTQWTSQAVFKVPQGQSFGAAGLSKGLVVLNSLPDASTVDSITTYVYKQNGTKWSEPVSVKLPPTAK